MKIKRVLAIAAAAAFGAAALLAIEIGGFADFLLRAAPSNPASGKARLYVDSATNLLTCLLSTGATCMPATTAAPFPNYLNVGSAVVAYISSTSAFTHWPGEGSGSHGNGCDQGTSSNVWPVAGYIRRSTITTSAANPAGLVFRGGAQPDCIGAFSGTEFPGGAFVPASAAAGSFVDASTQAGYLRQGGLLGFGFRLQNLSPTAPTVVAIAGEFVADTGYVTVFPAGGNTATTASATKYWGAYGVSNFTTETDVAIPIPIAGTASSLWWCPNSASPTNALTMTLRKNAAATAITVTAAAGVATQCATDFSNTASFAAGDYLDFQVVSGAGTVPSSGAWGVAMTTSSGTSTIMAGVIAGTVSTTATYSIPGASVTSATRAGKELGLPMACTAANLYVVQSVANGAGVTTTFTLEQNAADTAITGTVTSGSGTGALLLDGTHTVAFARGDLMQLKYVTGSGTSGTIGGWSITCN